VVATAWSGTGLHGLLDSIRTCNSLSTVSGVLGRGWPTSFEASLSVTRQGLPVSS
jgi:hypothetical protein